MKETILKTHQIDTLELIRITKWILFPVRNNEVSNKILAIKTVRCITKSGLRDAKNFVEAVISMWEKR